MTYDDSMSALVPMATNVDLSGGWTTFWGAVTSAAPSLTAIMSVLGILILLASLVSYIWSRMRGQGGDNGRLIWAIIAGAVLAAPGVLFPLFLGLADMVANSMIAIWAATQ